MGFRRIAKSNRGWGAYTGLPAAYFAMRYPNAQIIAIESSDENFELLTQNKAARQVRSGCSRAFFKAVDDFQSSCGAVRTCWSCETGHA